MAYSCIDCGAPVPRRVKRCPPCNTAFLKRRPTYVRTPEHRELMRKTQIGKPRNWRSGRPPSATPEVAQKIASWWTPERRAEARARGKAMAHNQASAWTPERRMLAMLEGQRQARDPQWRSRLRPRRGPESPSWQGGIGRQKYGPGFNAVLKAAIRRRDGYTCQLCGVTESALPYRLSIHHSDYDKTNHSGTNLFATCKSCNTRVNGRRDEWRAFFAGLAMGRQLREDIGDLLIAEIAAKTKAAG